MGRQKNKQTTNKQPTTHSFSVSGNTEMTDLHRKKPLSLPVHCLLHTSEVWIILISIYFFVQILLKLYFFGDSPVLNRINKNKLNEAEKY